MGDSIGGITGFIGGLEGNSDRDKATKALQDALLSYKQMDPTVHTQTQIFGDQANRDKQAQLLQQTMDRARQGGLNAMDRGRLDQIRSATGQMARSQQAAAMSDAQQRGALQGNSGILGALVAGQQAQDAAASGGLQAASLAQQNADAMNHEAAGQAGALRAQNIGVEEGNVERQMYQANQNKKNEFLRNQGQLAAAEPYAGQAMSNAQNTAAQWAAGGRLAGNMLSGGWGDWLDQIKKKGGGGGDGGFSPG